MNENGQEASPFPQISPDHVELINNTMETLGNTEESSDIFKATNRHKKKKQNDKAWPFPTFILKRF